MAELPPAPPGDWHRRAIPTRGAIDTHRTSWRSVLWMAIVPRGDGTYHVDVGRTRTRTGAWRQASQALHRLWLRHQLQSPP